MDVKCVMCVQCLACYQLFSSSPWWLASSLITTMLYIRLFSNSQLSLYKYVCCITTAPSSAASNTSDFKNWCFVDSTPIHLLNCHNTAPPSGRMFTLEESPLTNSLNAGNSGIAPLPSSRGKPVRFRSVFAGSISPMTPRYELWYLKHMSALNTVSMTHTLHEALSLSVFQKWLMTQKVTVCHEIWSHNILHT